jgi:hypothetical protein
LEYARRTTYEDPSIVTAEDRVEHFGQHDHVRRYGGPDFARRLEEAGFTVEAIHHLATLDPVFAGQHRMSGEFGTPTDERIWIAHKPTVEDPRTKESSSPE